MMVNDDDIGKCLTSLGIEKRQIIPTNVLRQQQPELNQFRNEINIFPLEWFDSSDANDFRFFMSCREGLAFLPLHQSTRVGIDPSDFEWRKVTVEKYNETTNKWRVEEITSGAIYEVPRIYLMFIVEKPFKYAQRIFSAQQLRNELENRLRFDSLLDNIVPPENIQLPQRLAENIVKLLSHAVDKRFEEFVVFNFSVHYEKTLVELNLMKFLEKNPSESIQLPTMAPRKAKRENLFANNGKLRKKIFEKSRNDFQRMWLYSCPQAIKIMEFINNACDELSEMSLFHNQTIAEDLDCFVNADKAKLSEISHFLRHHWIEEIVKGLVKNLLMETGKGWLDVNVDDWFVYRHSKLYRLIGLMNQRIQFGLQLRLRNSLREFCNRMCQPCESMMNVTEDFVWGNDLVESRFHSPQPVFSLSLDFNGNQNQPVFSTDIERFPIEIVELFKSRILKTHTTPRIDPYLVKNLVFEKGLTLSSIGFLDEEIQEQILHLEKCLRTALIPIKAYAREFCRFSDLKNLIIPEYVREWMESDKTAEEIKKEIFRQLKCIDEIEQSVPSTIVIGPFQINVEAVKHSLILKRQEIHESLIEMFVDKVKSELETADNNFKDIFTKMAQGIENVEKLVEVRDWTNTIDELVAEIEKKLEEIYEEIETLESMFIEIPESFNEMLFEFYGTPKKVHQKLAKTQTKLHFEFERFRKIQMADEIQFQEQVETLNDEVKACVVKHEFEDLSEISIECDKLWSALNEAMTYGEMLNNRQRIFSHPEIDMKKLNSLVKRLHPYHTLWTMISNFLVSKEHWLTSPLPSVDAKIVEAEIKRCENVVQDSRLHFTDDEEMMVLIEKISAVVDDACKTFDVLMDLKHPDFQEKQWRKLSEIADMIYRNVPEASFKTLITKGVLNFAKEVKEILTEATSTREFEEVQAEKKRTEDEELRKRNKARLAARSDI